MVMDETWSISGALRPSLVLPWFGRIENATAPAFLVTGVIAAVDGFNPCSLWVLFFPARTCCLERFPSAHTVRGSRISHGNRRGIWFVYPGIVLRTIVDQRGDGDSTARGDPGNRHGSCKCEGLSCLSQGVFSLDPETFPPDDRTSQAGDPQRRRRTDSSDCRNSTVRPGDQRGGARLHRRVFPDLDAVRRDARPLPGRVRRNRA